ncbi:MAG TPA: acyltransferase [Tepidisphaeraceae bacterium]|nr:acyltransferase [Tepidisphaeraceae bacterium]
MASKSYRLGTPVIDRDIEPWAQRFDMLDAWRGLAAVAVVLAHVAHWNIGGEAVMVFFVISGYCILASSDSCLRHGLGFRSFMWRRIRRIYPPYLLAVLFFVATRIIKVVMGGQSQIDASPVVWLQNLTLTQWLTLLTHPVPVASQNPSNFVTAFWSLNYEEQFYLVMAITMVCAAWLSRTWMVTVLMIISLGWILTFRQRCHGFFIEYWFHFGVGCVVFYRLCCMESRLARRVTDLGLCVGVLTFGYLAWANRVTSPTMTGVFRELTAVCTFAIVLVLARPLNDRFKASWVGWALMGLGTVSYSLYLIHQFNLNLIHGMVRLAIPDRFPALSIAAQVVGHIGLASIFWFFCERPFLNRSLDHATPASSSRSELVPVAADA